MTRITISFIITALLFCCELHAQLILKDSTVTIPAGAQYKASRWKEFWWGKHYRPEWIMPVQFPVINLEATAGGLTPMKMGGGHETKSLRLKGTDGREYVLRTMDKSLDLLVPEDFRGTFLNDIINDQISTAHPYGPIAAAKLADAAKLYHTNPAVVFVPADPALKEFEPVFANKLCLFEERPSGDGWSHTELTGNADDVVNTEDLLKNLLKDNDSKVDQQSFLRVRIYDVWINDWDRHEDQWVWLAHKHDDKTIYTAFGRDRDQTFSKTDGINIYFLSRPWVLPSLQNMDDKIKNVIGVTLSARYLDKEFLNELTEDDWKAEIESLQSTLTDEKIKAAIKSLPDTIFKLSGNELIEKLIARRNDMMRYGMAYYDILNHQVDVTGSAKKEFFSINNISSNQTEITVQKINKDGEKKDTMFHRIFDASVTKFIYLYGLGGDDIFNTSGNANSIKISIISGEGQDRFETASSKNYSGRIKIYDDPGNRVKLHKPYGAHFTNDSSRIVYNRKSFKYDYYRPSIIPGYNADDGVFLGAGFMYRKQRWEKTPYAWEQSIGFSVALETGAPNFFYNGSFSQVFGKWNLELNASFKGPEYVFNFYGYGNNTKLLFEKPFYRVRAEQFIVSPGVFRAFGNQQLAIDVIAEDLEVDNNADRFIKQPAAGVDSIIFDHNTFIGGDIKYSISKKDNDKNPSKGYNFQTSITYEKNITHTDKDFVNISSSFSFYIPFAKNLVFAHRTGGATNFGDFEFYHANTLGQNENLRGYYRSRFTGKTSFYQNTELRWALANLKGYVFRGKMGLYGFFDDGRVWMKNDNSDKIHIGYGPGLFFIPYNATVLNISLGVSSEKTLLRFGLDFLF
jgi:hypothetical protein